MIPRRSPTREFRVQEGAALAVAHVGLAHEKLMLHGSSNEARDASNRFLRHLADHVNAPDGYAFWFRRWVRRTLPGDLRGDRKRIARVAVSQGRVLCGLGEETPTENGLSIHPTYGVPYLPGSSLKGIVKAYLEQTDGVHDDWKRDGAVFKEVFGEAATGEEDEGGLSGTVIFHDALWIPGRADVPIAPWAAEILTPHFNDYYQKKDSPPHGMQSPVPVTFLAAQGAFRVVIEGPKALVVRMEEVVRRALRERGIGAKTRSGYGRLELLDEVSRDDEREQAEKRQRDEEQRRARALQQARTPEAVLDVLRTEYKLEPTELRNQVGWWLLGKPQVHDRLEPFPVTVEAALAVWAWAEENGVHGGLWKRVREELPEDIQKAVRARVEGPQDAVEEAPTLGFGPNRLDAFEDPSKLSKKKRQRWPNDFARRIASGNYDEATVRAAVEHLRANGGKEGHIKVILERYPLEA